jgi:rhodanese-related sulfurtransferase
MDKDVILMNREIDSRYLSFLLNEREKNNLIFYLVDYRETYKSESSSIIGTDINIPPSEVDKILSNFKKEDVIIIYTDDIRRLKKEAIHFIHAGIQNTHIIKEEFKDISMDLKTF